MGEPEPSACESGGSRAGEFSESPRGNRLGRRGTLGSQNARLSTAIGVTATHASRDGGTVIDALRRHLSYANVMATLAVFIALGGSSYAALSITGRDVKNRSLTHRDLKRNTLGGTRIKESRLGKVRRARNADRLNGLSSARLLVRCPDGTVPVSDVCVEAVPRAPAPYRTAVVVCEGIDRPETPGRRLPNHDELMSAIGDSGITLAPGGELTRNVFPSSDPGRLDVLVITDAVGNVAVAPDTAAGAKAFRCVADPLN